MMSSTQVNTMDLRQNIPSFFAGQGIFITGATGFLGKVLVEKLLRSCPDIDTMYILLRQKRNKSIQERLTDITNIPLFDRIKKEQPNALYKLHPIEGDIEKPELGISLKDRELLQERVSVVFHVAATVRFDEPLVKAVLINVRGTREVLRLAAGMKHLKIFLHTSTAFSNTPYPVIEERLYEAPMDWRSAIEMAETEDPILVRTITNKILGNRPNTYTFTKALAEHFIHDYRKELPVAIFRPSIVGCAAFEPIPGWLDNLYGPYGLMVGAGKGIVHVALMDEDIGQPFVPVDVTCKGMIIASWIEAQQRNQETSVYNASYSNTNDWIMRNIMQGSLAITKEFPFEDVIYYPSYISTRKFTVSYVLFLILQLLPSVFMDGVIRLSRGKPLLVKIQRRAFGATIALCYFSLNSWDIRTSKFRKLETSLKPEDEAAFNFEFSENSNAMVYTKNGVLGTRKYLMKENDETIPACRRQLHRLYLLHIFLQTVVYGSALWYCYSYSLLGKLASRTTALGETLLNL